MARPQVRFSLGQQRLAPKASPVDTYAPPAVEIPEGVVGGEWLEAAKALAPLTKSVSGFLQDIETKRRKKAPEEAELFIKNFDGDLSFLKEMPTLSREDAAAYLEENRAQFPTLKDDYAARPDFVLFAQALAGSRYVREAQTIEGPGGTMMTVSEALNSRLEEAMQPGADAAAIRKEVREQFLESIGRPQSEAWNMALVDGLTPLENAWDQRVREGKAQNTAWQADQDQKNAMAEALFGSVVHQAHPPTLESADDPNDEQTRRRNQEVQQGHDAETERLSNVIKNVYEASGKVGVRKRNSNTLNAIEQMLRDIQADDEDGLELAEAVEMLLAAEYADGQAFGDSGFFREGISKIEVELLREEAARKSARKESGQTRTTTMNQAVHNTLLPLLRERKPTSVEEARQIAEELRGEVNELFKANEMSEMDTAQALDEAAVYYMQGFGRNPVPPTPEAADTAKRVRDHIALGELDDARVLIQTQGDTLGTYISTLTQELEEADEAFETQDFVQRNKETLRKQLFPDDFVKTLRDGQQWQVDDLEAKAEQRFLEELLEVPLAEREAKAPEVRRRVAQAFEQAAEDLLEGASVLNNADELVDTQEINAFLEMAAERMLSIERPFVDSDGDGVADERGQLGAQDFFAVQERTTTLKRAARAEAARLLAKPLGNLSVRERISRIRRAIIEGDPELDAKGASVWMQAAIAPERQSRMPVEAGVGQREITSRGYEPATFAGTAEWLGPLTGALSESRGGQGEAARQGTIDVLGTPTGYLGNELGFFSLPTNVRGQQREVMDWSSPDARERLMQSPEYAQMFQTYQSFYPSNGRAMRIYLAGIARGLKPGQADENEAFDQIGLGLMPLTELSTPQVLPYLAEAVAATGLSFREVEAGRIAEADVRLTDLFGKDRLIASGVHIGPFDPEAFDNEVRLFESPANRTRSKYYKAFVGLGFSPDAQMVGDDQDGNPYPAGMTQGDFLMSRIKSNYNRRYRSVLPPSDLKALDTPTHSFGRLNVNEFPTSWRSLQGLEMVTEDLPEADIDREVHPPLIEYVVRQSRSLYDTQETPND